MIDRIIATLLLVLLPTTPIAVEPPLQLTVPAVRLYKTDGGVIDCQSGEEMKYRDWWKMEEE